MRKVIQGTRSVNGLENHTILRSLFETARRQGKKVQDFFYSLFTNETPETQAALYRNPPARARASHPSLLNLNSNAVLPGVGLNCYWNGWGDDNFVGSGSETAWAGTNSPSVRSKKRIQLYRSTFSNPFPNEITETIDYVSAMSLSAPFLVAMTVE